MGNVFSTMHHYRDVSGKPKIWTFLPPPPGVGLTLQVCLLPEHPEPVPEVSPRCLLTLHLLPWQDYKINFSFNENLLHKKPAEDYPRYFAKQNKGIFIVVLLFLLLIKPKYRYRPTRLFVPKWSFFSGKNINREELNLFPHSMDIRIKQALLMKISKFNIYTSYYMQYICWYF